MSATNDWTTLPLAGHGRSLVEASAGTGKTWTIAALYLRLLLEQGLTPRRIIVSTFTNAAAAELSERLRGKLLWALAEATQQAADIDGQSAQGEAADRRWLRKRWREDAGALSGDVQRLQAALAEFDAAPISTLHALCSRILADHPFAAGAPFRGRESIDGRTLEDALVDDLWRVIRQGDADQDLVRLAHDAGVDRAMLQRFVPALLQPDVVVACTSRADVVARIEAIVGDPGAWAAEVHAVLRQPKLLRAGGKLETAWRCLADALVDPHGDPGSVLASCADELRAATAMKGVNKAGQDHPAIGKLTRESAAIADCLSPLMLDCAGDGSLRRFLAAARGWCRDAMQARLDAANQCTFDQLLTLVGDALARGERALADALFEAWPVALVDEFQDTDPVQFGILDAIYRDIHGAPRGRLVMIGDPKQAIYRFRGGDVQAYERAKAGVDALDQLTLDTNFRSSRGYVEAVNQFYERTGRTLGPHSTITCQDVDASDRRDATPLCLAGDGTPVDRPLRLHVLETDWDAGDLEDHALRACAGEITQALSRTGYRIGDKPLAPGDIAVLLPGHAQIARLAAMLKARGVPCVSMSQKSVFDTDTARDLRLVLHAVLHPDDPRALRAALLTRIWGLGLGALQALGHDAAAWDAQARRFHALHERLAQRGPQALVGALLEQCAARLLDSIEGERMLTDLRHLGELLQEAWDGLGGGERLAAWFAHQVEGGGGGAEAADARALRLESDGARVKLMTLHASKGLEFPLVFLPLMWKHKRPRNATLGAQLLADERGGKHLVLGCAKQLVAAQEYEERFRILYVALTRAIHACHLFLLPRGDGLSGAIRDARRPGDIPLNSIDARLLDEDPPVRIARVAGWGAGGPPSWIPPEAVAAAVEARPLPPVPPGPLPMRHSFSTLSGGARQRAGEEGGAAEDEAWSADEAPGAAASAAGATAVMQTPHPELEALAGVAGADFGNALHAIFEHRVPRQPLTAQGALVRDALVQHGVRPRDGDAETLVAPLIRRLQAVLETPLGGAGGPRLFDLHAREMRAELEFNYLLDGVSLRALRVACATHGEPDLVPMRDQTIAGLMNGKIDLVFAHGGRFHVLDYKGNQLDRDAFARCIEAYAPEAVEAKMHATGYRFQALLYTVAVERYLRERLGDAYRRDAHLGDCWYLFVRAVGLRLPDGTPCGVWRHRFGDALLDAVQRVLGAATQAEAA